MAEPSAHVTIQPRVCRECNTTVLSGQWRERCLNCGELYEAAARPALSIREPGPYDCPLCNEGPRSCTCLRPSVRRRIAAVIGA